MTALPDMAWRLDHPWLPLTPPMTSGTTSRSGVITDRIVAQFGLDTGKRWQKLVEQLAGGLTKVSTYCNIWLNDITRALGCEVPRWWLVGAELKQLSANDQVRWLQRDGRKHGWRECTPFEAQARANLGHVSVVGWINPEVHPVTKRELSGHVALFVPDNGEAGLFIAQAGLTNFSRGTLTSGFGSRNVVCFTHD
ncbi:MAG: hypothetical protein Q8L48_16690 [Archangium sp.]|nr:hypothetical protein [Archangium sp.]